MKKHTITMRLIAVALVFVVSVHVSNGQIYTFNNDLTLGSSGSDVSQLQTWLINNGYNIPSISSGVTGKGYFGSQTKTALIALQRSAGLTANGFFGPLTRQYFNNRGGNGCGNGSYTGVCPSSFNIISPNGGESWQKGTIHNITWNSPYFIRATYVDIKLIPYQAPCTSQICPMIAQMIRAPYAVATNININQHSYSWNAGSYIFNTGVVPGYTADPLSFPVVVPDGQYTVQICQTGSSICAASNSSFTIYSNGQPNNNQPGSITIISPNGGEVWNVGENRVISWNINYPTDQYGRQLPIVPFAFMSDVYLVSAGCSYPMTCMTLPQPIAKNVQGPSYTWTVGTLMANTGVTGSYKIEICQAGAMSVCGTSNASFTINSSSNSSVPDINIVSPNGGGTWQTGTTQTITVNVIGDANRVGNIVSTYLVDTSNRQTLLQSYTNIASPYVTPGIKTYTVSVPSTVSLGTYKLLVNLYSAVLGGSNPQLQAYDYSDNYFTITNNYYNYSGGYNSSSICPAGYVCTPYAR
jgi:peptidoglycan hydrolase-like protein with peptidoglycan-binding domain